MVEVITYQRVPRTGTQTDTVIADAQTADTVLMPTQGANLVSTEDIPDLREIGSVRRLNEWDMTRRWLTLHSKSS